MKNLLLLFVLIFFLKADLFSQTILLNNGFQELQLGISKEQVEEIIGFKGKTISQQEYLGTQMGNREPSTLPAYRNNFDQCILYNHIMPVPVTKLFLKDNSVISIEISSFPSFSRPICLETQTPEGLTFWDSRAKMIDIYGENFREVNITDEYSIYYYDSEGIGFGITNNEVRVIHFYVNK